MPTKTNHSVKKKMSLIDGLFAIGLYVPLSTLSFRILVDALSFHKFVQRQIQRIKTIQQLNHELCVRQALQWNVDHDVDMLTMTAHSNVDVGDEMMSEHRAMISEMEPVPYRELSLTRNHELCSYISVLLLLILANLLFRKKKEEWNFCDC